MKKEKKTLYLSIYTYIQRQTARHANLQTHTDAMQPPRFILEKKCIHVAYT